MSYTTTAPTTENSSRRSVLPNSGDSEHVTTAEEWFQKCRRARLQFERQWYVNLAFYFGKQYVTWSKNQNTSLNRLWEPPAPPWRVRLVSNKIKPMFRRELSKVIKEKPTAFVIPASSEDMDIAAAKAGEQIYEYLERTLYMQRVTRRMAFWLLATGTSFVKDWWDANKMDPTGTKGSICVEPVTPFHFFVPDVQEEEIEHQPYVIHVLAKSPDWVKQTYGKDVQADSIVGGDLLQQKFLQAVDIHDMPQEYVSVKECWVKPCSKYKDGAVITWANESLLSLVEGWPYTHDEFPFTKFDHIPTGRFFSDSTLPDLIPLQKEYNRTRSQLIEAKNRMAKPQLLAPRGSIDPSKITSEPGLVILYTPGFQPPVALALSQMPTYVLEEINRTQADMDDISSQHEVSKGRTPPGVEAATAISYLQEQDDSVLAPTITSLEEGVERIGKHMLSHVQQYWEQDRQIEVAGSDDTFETRVFNAESINGNTNLKVQAGSATPRSQAAKQAFIMELGKMGWIPPDRALKYLEMSETGRMYEELQIDSRQAQRENLKMMMYTPPDPMQQPPPDPNNPQAPPPPDPNAVTVNTWDNDMVHITEHDNFRKRQEFENAPPEIKAIFEQHVNDHRLKLQSTMMPPGGGAGAPVPPGGSTPGPGPGGPPGGTGAPGPMPPMPPVPPAPPQGP